MEHFYNNFFKLKNEFLILKEDFLILENTDFTHNFLHCGKKIGIL